MTDASRPSVEQEGPHITAVSYAKGYLLRPGEDAVTPFEQGMVRSIAAHWLEGYFAAKTQLAAAEQEIQTLKAEREKWNQVVDGFVITERRPRAVHVLETKLEAAQQEIATLRAQLEPRS